MTDLSSLPPGLPESVIRLAEYRPLENLILAILQERMPDVAIRPGIPGEEGLVPQEVMRGRTSLMVIVRRAPGYGVWAGDKRFFDQGGISIQVFTYGPDNEEVASLVNEAVRVALRDAQQEQRVYPELGSLAAVWLEDEGKPMSDWATATGPVQYADLPEGWHRLEARHQVTVRRPRNW